MPRPPKPSNESTYAGRVAAAIRARRTRKKLSVEAAADRAGMPRPTWYAVESGRSLTIERLPAIAAALGCQPRQLLP